MKINIPLNYFSDLKNKKEINLSDLLLNKEYEVLQHKKNVNLFFDILKIICEEKLIKLSNFKIFEENIFLKKLDNDEYEMYIKRVNNYKKSFAYIIEALVMRINNFNSHKKDFIKCIKKIIKKIDEKSAFNFFKEIVVKYVPYNSIQSVSFFKLLYSKFNEKFLDIYLKNFLISLPNALKDEKIRDVLFDYLKNNFSEEYKPQYITLSLILGNKKAESMMATISAYFLNILKILDNILKKDLIKYIDIEIVSDILLNKSKSYPIISEYDYHEFVNFYLNEFIKMRECDYFEPNFEILNFIEKYNLMKLLPSDCLYKIEMLLIDNLFEI
jgi:hypothetical protein